MSIELFYFSGTGNTIHVTNELEKRMPNTILTPIVRVLKNGNFKIKSKIVGIIFPIHAHTFPKIVKNFLMKVDLSSTRYLFAISTRYCASKVFKDMNKLLKKQNKKLDASFAVNTPVNYIPIFSVPTNEEITEIEAKLQEELDNLVPYIINKESRQEDTGFLLAVLANTLLRFSNFLFTKTNYFGLQNSFYADDKCINCGTCEKICLSEKIKIVNGKPVWQKDVDCFYCFACISFCPVLAIQAKGKRTKRKGRYRHPLIKSSDIANQK